MGIEYNRLAGWEFAYIRYREFGLRKKFRKNDVFLLAWLAFSEFGYIVIDVTGERQVKQSNQEEKHHEKHDHHHRQLHPLFR